MGRHRGRLIAGMIAVSLAVLVLLIAGLPGGLNGVIRAESLDSTPSIVHQADNPTEVVIGALLDRTGPWSSLGKSSDVALTLAQEDVNAYLQQTGANLRVKVIVADTRGDPAVALDQLQGLSRQGAHLVIGPQSSAEVEKVKSYADAQGILVVSQGSTASALAIPRDNVFRLVPDDTHEAAAITALMAADGIKVIVPVWRGDAGNDGLHAAVTKAFTARGGTVTNGVRYDPTTTNFSAVLNAAKAQARPAIDQYGADKVAIYLAGFDEVVPLFDQAANDSVLASLRWYGSDGIALSPALIQNARAAGFAAKVDYPNPLPGLDERAKDNWEPIAQRFSARVGHAPDTFTLATYDAVWIATLAYLTTGPTPTIDALKLAFTHTANSYYGTTGWTALNAAGDRTTGNYDYWGVRGNNGSFQWVRVGRYEESTAGQPGRVVPGVVASP